MFKFGERKPVLFEIILIIVAFLAAAAFTAVGSIFNVHPDLSSSVGRVVVGVFLLLVYRRAFTSERSESSFAIVLPALLFAVWNLYYNLSSGAQLGGMNFYLEALITAIAPAIFEEVIFRGIFIYNLRQKGCGDIKCLFITAIVFALLHATNIVGQDLVTVALQVGYSFVIGLVLAAIYLRNNSLLQIILVHFLIDFTNRIYIDPATSATTTQLVIFVVLLAVEAVYAIVLCSAKKRTE